MGVYLNPGNTFFQEAIQSQIYVDKTGMISYVNRVLGTEQKYICVSRPRRFGKSMAAKMLAAYYGRECDSRQLFDGLKIAADPAYLRHLNQYNVIFLNMQDFLSNTHDIEKMQELLEKSIIRDLLRAYPDVDYFDQTNLVSMLKDIFAETEMRFVFIIDEWDCIFREKKDAEHEQNHYLDFLRNLLKDKIYVKLVYMTGILPVKKYGTHSALNMFDEFSMVEPRQLSEYVGFSESEVKKLCTEYHMDFNEIKRWYDGYTFKGTEHIYNPRSVVAAMLSGEYSNYWSQTETYEALKVYIDMNFEGLKDIIIELLAGDRYRIDTGTFSNDMTTFQSVDDVLTLLIHLGYLAYDFAAKEVFIPNSEISGEFVSAMKGAGWNAVVQAVKNSDTLLKATWNRDTEAVARAIGNAHMDTSILTYNDENALSYTVALAYYSASVYYTIIRELPTGKGFADMVFLPRKRYSDKPAILVELKWDHSAETAIWQIYNKKYVRALEEYKGNLLLVGINYDKKTKEHTCEIDSWELT